MKDERFHCTCGWFNCTVMTQWRLTFPLCSVFVPELLTFCRAIAIPTNAYHNDDMLCSIGWVPGLDLIVRTSACTLTGTPPPWQTNHGQLCYHGICTLLHTPETPTANYPQPPPGRSSAPLCFSREMKEGEGKNTHTNSYILLPSQRGEDNTLKLCVAL